MLPGAMNLTTPSAAPIGFTLRKPYLLFIGDAQDEAEAKTACGLRDWARDACMAQLRLPQSRLDLGLPDMSPDAAARAGAGSLVIGVAPVGGQIPREWEPVLHAAIAAGLDVVSGMHRPLEGVPGLAEAARKRGVALVNVRLPRQNFPDCQRPTPQRQATAHGGNRLRARQEIHRTRLDRGDARARHRGRFSRDRPDRHPDRRQRHRSRRRHRRLRGRRSGAAVARSGARSLGRDRRPGLVVSSGLRRRDARARARLAAGRPDPLPRSRRACTFTRFPDFPTPDLRTAAARYVEAARLTNPERDARRREPEHVDAR